ncbi:hypothetical protein SELMODRAFT_28760, partial [Selaginella moellendorffii]
PLLEHYGCLVGALARAGQLQFAEELVETMPFEADDKVWGSLLSACRTQHDAGRGARVAENVFKLDPASDAAHVMLSNIYAA